MNDTVSECCAETERTVAPTKFHTALNVANLAKSIEFYRLLFGSEPAKQRADYAKFELDEPPLVLSLIPGRPAPGGCLNHFGLRVANAEILVDIQRRLELGGLRTKREEGVECCYARQTKFWIADPDRVMWEIYVVHEDIDDHGDGMVPAAEEVSTTAGAEPAPRVIWQHRIGEPIPERIPHDEYSVYEVVLEGSANTAASRDGLASLLAEAHRVLRPGGELRLHGLTGDAPLTAPLPALPGPAAAVEYVPSHREVVREMEAVGFVALKLETLSAKTHFTVGEVGLREILVSGRKAGHRPKAQLHSAVYLGPFERVTDDFGNCFQRGEVTPLNRHDWQRLSDNAESSDFLFL